MLRSLSRANETFPSNVVSFELCFGAVFPKLTLAMFLSRISYADDLGSVLVPQVLFLSSVS